MKIFGKAKRFLAISLSLMMTAAVTPCLAFADAGSSATNPADGYGLITKNLEATGQADFETSIAVQDSVNVTGNISVNSVYQGVNSSAPKATYDAVLGDDLKDDYANGDGTNNVWNSYIEDENGVHHLVTSYKPATAANGQQYASITTENDKWFEDAFDNADDLIKYVEANGNPVDGKCTINGKTYVIIDQDIINSESTSDGSIVSDGTGDLVDHVNNDDSKGRNVGNSITYLCKMATINITGSLLYGNFYAPNTVVNISGSSICGQVICNTWKVSNGAEVHMPNAGIKSTQTPSTPSGGSTPSSNPSGGSTPSSNPSGGTTPSTNPTGGSTPSTPVTPNPSNGPNGTVNPSGTGTGAGTSQNPGTTQNPGQTPSQTQTPQTPQTPQTTATTTNPVTPSTVAAVETTETTSGSASKSAITNTSVKGSNSSAYPETGDEAVLGFYGMMMLISAAGIITIRRRAR